MSETPLPPRNQTLTCVYQGHKIVVEINYRRIWNRVKVTVYRPGKWVGDRLVWIPEYSTHTRDVRSAFAYGFNHVAYEVDGVASWPAGLPDRSRPAPIQSRRRYPPDLSYARRNYKTDEYGEPLK